MNATTYKAYTLANIDKIPELARVPQSTLFEMKVVANILPFRVNNYVIEKLIDWDNVPDDPIFKMTFPQRDMLRDEDFARVKESLDKDFSKEKHNAILADIHHSLNPHPSGQLEMNVPTLGLERLHGLQHKYRETVLFFPSQGQVCHAYCTFCFRWAQFIGNKDLRFASHDVEQLQDYLRAHQEVTDLLITGGDPFVMKTRQLQVYLDGLLAEGLDHVENIRIGTKAFSFWPHRFVNDPDSDDLLRLLERMVKSGKHVSIMAHLNHWRELETDTVREAIRRVRDTGALIRSQGPLLAHVNDDASTWMRLWRTQIQLGIIPYYMFVERDTGAQHYFKVPLIKAWEIYQTAIQQLSGIGRTVRGPSMSAEPGKVEVQGIAEIAGEKVFVLRFLQARNPDWVHRPFFAQFDEDAVWLDDLKPAFGRDKFFYEELGIENLRPATAIPVVSSDHSLLLI